MVEDTIYICSIYQTADVKVEDILLANLTPTPHGSGRRKKNILYKAM